jgi:hypothetical protein
MRGPIHASSTAVLLSCAAAVAGCAASTPAPVARRDPPARTLMVELDRITLRENAALELHAWLAAAARDNAPSTRAPAATPELVGAYARGLAKDEDDALLARTSAALGSCTDDTCTRRALEGTPFATPFAAALGPFVAREWTAFATTSRQGVEAVLAAFGPEADALALRVARDLAMTWPEQRVAVDVVTSAIPPGRAAPIPAVLSARGRCFMRDRRETDRMHSARIVDCVLVYALLGQRERSDIGRELGRALPGEEARRAWTLLVVQAVAATVGAWEPKHDAVLARSAAAVSRPAMSWLADAWGSRTSGESASSFAARYAAELREEAEGEP